MKILQSFKEWRERAAFFKKHNKVEGKPLILSAQDYAEAPEHLRRFAQTLRGSGNE